MNDFLSGNLGIDSSNTTGNYYIKACLSPENMQELEAMVRRVVAEELDKFFEDEQEPEEETTGSVFIGQD